MPYAHKAIKALPTLEVREAAIHKAAAFPFIWRDAFLRLFGAPVHIVRFALQLGKPMEIAESSLILPMSGSLTLAAHNPFPL